MECLYKGKRFLFSLVDVEDFVGDSGPPSGLFWSDVLQGGEGERKRSRPTGLMSSQEARRLAQRKK